MDHTGALLSHHLGGIHVGVGSKESLLQFRALRITEGNGQSLFSANGAGQEFREAVRSKGDVGGNPAHVFRLDASLVFVSFHLLEGLGIHGSVNPFLGIGISGDSFFSAAQLRSLFGLTVFDPLVIFHVSAHLNGVYLDAENRVSQLVVCDGVPPGIHQLAFKSAVNLVDAGYGLRHHLSFGNGVARAYGAAFIPPQQYGSRDDQENACSDSLEGISEAGKPTGACNFRVRTVFIAHGFFLAKMVALFRGINFPLPK